MIALQQQPWLFTAAVQLAIARVFETKSEIKSQGQNSMLVNALQHLDHTCGNASFPHVVVLNQHSPCMLRVENQSVRIPEAKGCKLER